MVTEEELIEAVRNTLDQEGILARIKGEIKCEVMNVLGINGIQNIKKPSVPPQISLINELIKEYFSWLGYNYTNCILIAESSSSPTEHEMTRNQMETELGIKESTDTSIPLLYTVITQMKNKQQ